MKFKDVMRFVGDAAEFVESIAANKEEVDELVRIVNGFTGVLAEARRKQRWYATFNAALTGSLAHGDFVPVARGKAWDAADQVHGPLKKEPA